MAGLAVRKDRRAGRITLDRPQALNALTHPMVRDLHAALDLWRDGDDVDLVVIDAVGDKAFCAGGDIAEVYRAARGKDHATGQRFFADEYRMNAAIGEFPKPIVAFMHGFVMGGGVGVGGHASHRVVGDTTRIAMPEAGIGLIPDVGGSWLLGRAPGRIGEYLALTASRMGPGDAIHAGFADVYLPESQWPSMIETIVTTGSVAALHGDKLPDAPLAQRDLSAFGGRNMAAIIAALEKDGEDETLSSLHRNSPLSMAAALRTVRAARGDPGLRESLAREYRFTYRASASSDFLEGVRAQIIDKDRKPDWRADASADAVDAILAPLGDHELTFD